MAFGAPHASPAPRRPALVPLVGVVLGVLLLSGLGVWQVQRLHWKTQMLQRIAALRTAPPEPLSVVLNRIPDHVDVDFTHVIFSCPNLERTPVARVYAVGEAGPGDRLVTACPVSAGPYRSVLVDRGFLPDDASQTFRSGGEPLHDDVIGVLRTAAPPGRAPPPRGQGGRFYGRDYAAVAADLKAPAPAPVFVMLESPKPASGPTPEPVPTDIPNNHLGYAITWFGLALALVGVYVASLVKRARD